jgi:hypothetical protein
MVSRRLDSPDVHEKMINLEPVQKGKVARNLQGAHCEIRRDTSGFARIAPFPGPGTSGTETR